MRGAPKLYRMEGDTVQNNDKKHSGVDELIDALTTQEENEDTPLSGSARTMLTDAIDQSDVASQLLDAARVRFAQGRRVNTLKH